MQADNPKHARENRSGDDAIASAAGPAVSRRTACWLLFGVLVIGLVLRVAFFSGYQGHDDSHYIGYAQVFAAEGRIGPENTTAWLGRIGIWLPMAACMKLAGPGQASIVAYPFLCSMANIILAYALGCLLLDRRVGLLGALLMAFMPIEVIMASYAYTDLAWGMYMVATFAFFLAAEKGHGRWGYFAAGLAAGLAYLHKEPAIFLAAPFAVYCLAFRSIKKEYLLVLLGGLSIVACEMLFWQAMVGDPTFRFKTVLSEYQTPEEAGSNAAAATAQPSHKFYRGSNACLEPLLMFTTNQEFGLFFYLIWPLCLYYLFRRSRSTSLLVMWLVSLGLVIAYLPGPSGNPLLTRSPRYYTCLTIPGLVLLAYFLCNLRPAWRWAVIAVLLGSSLACMYLDGSRSHRVTERRLYAFYREHSDRPIWVHPQVAICFSVESAFRRDPNVRVHLLTCTEKANALATIRMMYPDLAVASDARDITAGYAVVRADRKPEYTEHWRLVKTVSAERDSRVKLIQRTLALAGVPKAFIDRLSPSEGRAFNIWRIDPANPATSDTEPSKDEKPNETRSSDL